MARRERRKFSHEYRAEVVALVRSSGKSIVEISRDLDLTERKPLGWPRLGSDCADDEFVSAPLVVGPPTASTTTRSELTSRGTRHRTLMRIAESGSGDAELVDHIRHGEL